MPGASAVPVECVSVKMIVAQSRLTQCVQEAWLQENSPCHQCENSTLTITTTTKV